MNTLKLKAAEKYFFTRYPEGFSSPEMIEISKKHKPEKMHSMARELFSKDAFSDTEKTIENMIKIISRSSMVSVFEKPKFRDYARSLDSGEKEILVRGLEDFLYKDQETGFSAMVDILLPGKIAKWPVITVIAEYFNPQVEIFVKPTTAKNILSFFEIDYPVYKPRPSFNFYKEYRNVINSMKKEVSAALSPSNAAFCGFLMMSMDPEK